MAKPKTTPATGQQLSRPIPIDWDVPKELTTRLATHFVVQNTGHEVIVSFFEVYPPLLVGTPEEQHATFEAIAGVRAECVGRVAIAAGRIEELVALLRGNIPATQLAAKEGEPA